MTYSMGYQCGVTMVCAWMLEYEWLSDEKTLPLMAIVRRAAAP